MFPLGPSAPLPSAVDELREANRMRKSRSMTFQRFGRSYHLRLRCAADLQDVLSLDEAHWVATGAPVGTINCDPTFLDLVDSDADGRILVYEIRQAVSWLLETLADHTGIDEATTTLALGAINTNTDAGRLIHQSARRMLDRLGLPDASEITLAQVRQIKAQIEGTPISEVGVVLDEAFEDESIRRFVADVIAATGGAPHPSGSAGIAEEPLASFLSQARAYLAWRAAGQVPQGAEASEIMPLGERTAAAFDALVAIREKVDQYFAQCEAVSCDGRTSAEMAPSRTELAATDFDSPEAIVEFMKRSPLAPVGGDGVLAFDQAVNPHYATALAALRSETIEPVLGEDFSNAQRLSAGQWLEVKRRLAAHEAWLAQKVGRAVEPLGADKLIEYVQPRYADAVRSRIAQSAQTAFVLDNIRLTEKLICYQGHLLELVNNFVSFPYLYDPTSRAMFEMGTLIMDGRRLNFSVRVDNRAEHAAISRTSVMYLLYVEVTPAAPALKYEVATAVTSGGKGNLAVGKRGIFVDIHGRQADARVVEIIENPISVAEALASPFQRIGRLVSGKIEAITTSAEKKLETTTTTAMNRAESSSPAAPTAQPSRGLMAGGLLMGGGVAIAALGSAVAYITKTVAQVEHWWKILVVIGTALLAVMLPVSILAILKLRRRDLSAILEGSGWAINARMRLTFRQGRTFTRQPAYPARARGVHSKRWWVMALVAALAAAIALGTYAKHRSRTGKMPATTDTTAPADSAQQESLPPSNVS